MSAPLLAILIPTTPDRRELLSRLTWELNRSMATHFTSSGQLTIIVDESPRHDKQTNEHSTGKKRNELIHCALSAGAKAIAFHDDDDLPGPTYLKRGLEFASSEYDCAELWGQIYFNGKRGNPFHHYLDCRNPATGKIEWWQDDKFYYRTINHLNFVKLDLIKNIQFPDQVFGEDGQWSERVQAAGVLKTMMPIPEVIYHYFVGEPKKELI